MTPRRHGGTGDGVRARPGQRQIVLSGRRLGLRARATATFALLALVLSAALAVLGFVLVRRQLLDQRLDLARRQALVDALAVRAGVEGADADVGRTVRGLVLDRDAGALVHFGGRWFASSVSLRPESVPAALQALVAAGGAGWQWDWEGGEPRLAVGVAITGAGAEYYEVYEVDDLQRNLDALRTSLVAASALTTVLGAVAGRLIARPLLRPLSRVASAADALAHGGLDTRLRSEVDPDLARLANSFNDMATRLQDRIERDARFASDVAHELRTPLTAIGASVEVLQTRRDELSDRGRQALDVLAAQVRRFDRMVVDLLELARIDAGAGELRAEATALDAFVRRVMDSTGFAATPVDVDAAAAGALVALDRRRIERVLANLLDNATVHGGGPVRVSLEGSDEAVAVAVEDAGRGIAPDERARVFERFARGRASRHRVGTGLGLSIVAEQVRLHGGEVHAEERPGGGARVVFTLPRGQ